MKGIGMAGVKLGTWNDGISDLNNGEFSRSVAFKSSADKRLVAAAKSGDFETLVGSWIKANAATSKKQKKSWGRVLDAIRWSESTFTDSHNSTSAFAKLARQTAKTANRETGKKKTSDATSRKFNKVLKKQTGVICEPLELLAALVLLVESGAKLEPETAGKCFRLVLESSLQFLQTVDVPVSDDYTLADQRLVLAGELPWLIGSVFGDLTGASATVKSASDFIFEEIDARTDTDGTPQAELLDRLPLWLGSFVRVSLAADAFGVTFWKGDAKDRFEDVLRRASGLCQSSGRLALSNGVAMQPAEILRTGILSSELSQKDPARVYLDVIDLGKSTVGKTRGEKPQSSRASLLPKKFKEANSPSTQSDWARMAALRNNWSPGADSFAIGHDREIPRIEMVAFGTQVMAGEWNVDVTIDGQPVTPGDWDCSCWNTDKDGDYLELTADLSDDWKFDRMIFLSRNDHFCFLSDCVVGKGAADIHYQSLLPVVDGAKPQVDSLTREVGLKCGPVRARCYPLGVPQDRVHSTDGSLNVEHGHLAVSHSRHGAGLCVPLFIDWSQNRRNRPADWAQLSIADDGEFVTPDDATAYRIRIGKHQWLMYHAMRPTSRSRSVLGLHTLNETVIGEFSNTGDVLPLLLVDPNENED